MKNTKRFLSLLGLLLLLGSLSGCFDLVGLGDDSDSDSDQQTQSNANSENGG